MKTKVFIHGHEGTTGLRIHERLKSREDIELVPIADELRKEPEAIAECMKKADLAFLCLPDGAAKEAVAIAADCQVRLIDTSTAHRTADGWTYGFPELSQAQYQAIAESDRVANPGCHASGVIAVVQPLVQAGILPDDYPVSAVSLTGYSGGGKKMIAQYEGADKGEDLFSPRQYGLTQQHKHLKEIVAVCGLAQKPIFSPIVDDYYSGMEVMVPLFTHLLKGTPSAQDIWQALAAHYEGSPVVRVLPFGEDKSGFVAANAMSGYDDMEILVTGNDQRVVVTALFDNLGKGASGAAIQNMNIMLGLDPTTGLQITK
ncbi:N-acetyl-gamma-glutamyl-phosphate reductase [uncultured Megasphaera sp.]|uniref:N-acetyl-gamma-glutamyl-phosphate reductase n=1 Tax=uncultured Megasphaera sp. TaxID=165188 RepID=UPI0026295DE5|nr:N-acetyl-gamma-glutamyl-phosphate reductase [uncultured Megasphaera sp.]